MSHQSSISFKDTRSATVRQYGTRFRFFTPANDSGHERERHFQGCSRRHINRGGDQELASAGWQAASGLFGIDGISYVTMRPFEVNIHRCIAFDWSELHDDIMAVLEASDPTFAKPVPEPVKCRVRRIRWFDTRSDQVRNYGLTMRLFRPLHNLNTELGMPDTIGSHDPATVYSPTVLQALRAITAIEGVTSLTVRPFEINVFKYDHFSFAEMHDRIIAALKAVFEGSEPIEVHNRAEY